MRATLKANAAETATICLCFLLASTGYLSWFHRLMELSESVGVEYPALVIGYLAQAVGIGIFMAVMRAIREADDVAVRRVGIATLVLYVAILAPATLSNDFATVFTFGCLLNVLAGMIQAHYLALLAMRVECASRGTVFGCGYAVSTLLTLALSLPGGGVLASGIPCLACCFVLAAGAFLLMRGMAKVTPVIAETSGARAGAAAAPGNDTGTEAAVAGSEGGIEPAASGNEACNPGEFGYELVVPAHAVPFPAWQPAREPVAPACQPAPARSDILLAASAIVAACLVSAVGFSFPATDLASGVSLELSRVLYGLGIAIVGLAADRDRRLAMGACAVSLVTPFLMFSLSGVGITGALLWALGYLFTGVYVLFSALVGVDMASAGRRPERAGAGMLMRYVGDAVGAWLCLTLARFPIALIMIACVVFLATAVLFVMLYRRLYSPATETVSDEQRQRELFSLFAARYDLTLRERDVLRLVLAGKSNAEIAGELVVSERTVKFHMTNLLKKTSCKNRLDMIDKFAQS